MIYGFSTLKDTQRIDRVVNKVERMREPPRSRRGPSGGQNFYPRIGYFNDSGFIIPSFGVVLIKGSQGQLTDTKLGPAQGVVAKVKRPDTYGCQYNALVSDEGRWGTDSGPAEYKDQTFGAAQAYPPFIAAYDKDDGTPVFGELWGPRSGTFLLKKNTGGFRIIGIYDGTDHAIGLGLTSGYALVMPEPFVDFRGVADADIAADATGTVSIYYRSGATAFTDSTVNATALNDLDGTVSSGKTCRCRFESYMNAGVYTEGWVIYQADCS